MLMDPLKCLIDPVEVAIALVVEDAEPDEIDIGSDAGVASILGPTMPATCVP